MKVQTSIIALLVFPFAFGYSQLQAELGLHYEEDRIGEEGTYIGCTYGLEGIEGIPDTILYAFLDSLCRADSCNRATFYTSDFYAKRPHYDEADDYQLGVYFWGDNYIENGFSPYEDDSLEKALPEILSAFIIGMIVLVFVWYIRDKRPSLSRAATRSNKNHKIEVPEEVLDAADKINHRSYEDFSYSVMWAKKILARPDQYVILDTETTGTGNRDVVVEIAVTDLDGNPILNTRVKPEMLKRISADARAVHGISMEDLEGAPRFRDIVKELGEATSGKIVLIYNAKFDERLIEQTAYSEGVSSPYIKTDCVMLKYSQYKGAWNDYHRDYRWQKLPGANHGALGDCQATAKVISKMASHWPGEITEK